MWWPFQWAVIYVLGGLTFIPLAVLIVVGYALTYGSVPIGDPDPEKTKKAELQLQHEREELLERGKAAQGKPLSGWLTVRRQFQPSSSGSSMFMPTIPMSNPEASPTDTDKDKEEGGLDRDDASVKSGAATPANGGGATGAGAPTTYSARIAQTYRQMVESRQKNTTPPKEYFFCVLKGRVLFLYEDEAQSECVAAIGVDKYSVGVEGKDGGAFTGKDAEMFAKRNAVVMRLCDTQGEGKDGLPVLSKGMTSTEESKEEAAEKELAPWFLFAKSNTKMEDWYLALTCASAAQPSTEGVFSERDMQALVDTIDTEPDPIPMRWLNAMIGRIFFGLYRTEALEQFIIAKIMKKLSKVPRPSFLSPIVIREVNVGTFPPILSKPMLKDLTAEGTASFEVHLNYHSRANQPNSEVRVTIATTATIPTGFKPYVVDLVLAVVLKSLEGNLVMQIKKPPSNRFWYGFTSMPKMEVEILPIVSERKIQIGMVLKAIEKQLRDVIAESVVLPNMDDIAFFDTSTLDIRGGIFSSAGKVVRKPTTDILSGGEETPTQPGVNISNTTENATPAPTPEAAGLRKRTPAKAQTMDVGARPISPTGHASDSETVGNPPVAKKAASIHATKKGWFANGRPPSITSLGALSLGGASKESLEKPRSASVERSHVDALPATAHPMEPSASSPELVKKAGTSLAEKNEEEGTKTPDSYHNLARTSVDTLDSTNTITTAPAGVDPALSSSDTVSTASLITSLRARDKKAVQAQVTGARDAMKKWGVNWAAKRETTLAALTDEVEAKPIPVYRPPDDDERGEPLSQSLSRSAEGPKSLQERLNAAAATANRPKSGSVSSTSPVQVTASRPTLQPSPSSKSTAMFGTSPPQWTLSAAGPTTGVARADVAVRPGTTTPPKSRTPPKVVQDQHTQAQPRRGSMTNPVFTQPAAGRSMIVPRVPKRPGEVVGIGSSEMGITRRISGTDEGSERMTRQGSGHSSRAGTQTANSEKERKKETEKPGAEYHGAVPPPGLPPRPASFDESEAVTGDEKRSITEDHTTHPALERTGSAPVVPVAVSATPALPPRLSQLDDAVPPRPTGTPEPGMAITDESDMPEAAAPITNLLEDSDDEEEADGATAQEEAELRATAEQAHVDGASAEDMLRNLVKREHAREQRSERVDTTGLTDP